MKQQFTLRSAVVLVFTLAVAGTAFGNGEEFFKPKDLNGPVDLVYVGQVRDATTGRQIKELANIVVTDKSSGMTFLFTGDVPGHYHSPDIGASLKALGNTVSANSLEMLVMITGYENLTMKVPRKVTGTVEVNFKMVPLGQAAAGLPQNTDSPGGSGTWLWLTLCGGLAVIVVGAMLRTFVPRQTTTP